MGEKVKKTTRRKVKCGKCGKELYNTDPEAIKRGGRYYCTTCHTNVSEQADSWKSLMDTVVNYFDIKAPTGIILKQIKEYESLYGYTYAGIAYTLWYCKEIEGKEFDPNCAITYGIACVKFNYERARMYFEQQQRIATSVANVATEEDRRKTIKIDLNKVYEERKTKMVDFASLLGGET